jgi:hypothetical protein
VSETPGVFLIMPRDGDSILIGEDSSIVVVEGLLRRRRSYMKKHLRKINTENNAEATFQGTST